MKDDAISFAVVQAITSDAGKWFVPLDTACSAFEINTPVRQAMFMAQCAHESNGFRVLAEDLHYSAAALLRVWPSRFTFAEANEFANNPGRIAERVYGGRMGTGPEGDGDGYKYRGRGIIQLTGKMNYQMAGRALHQEYLARPELVEYPDDAALVAAWYWSVHGCNELADNGAFTEITKRINGGLNGLEARLAWLDKVGDVA